MCGSKNRVRNCAWVFDVQNCVLCVFVFVGVVDHDGFWGVPSIIVFLAVL